MKTIPLTKGLSALVDDEDFPVLSRFNWCARKHASGRAEAVTTLLFRRRDGSIQKVMLNMQTLVMGRRQFRKIDHADRDALNNTKQNLRWATDSQNAVNWWRESKYGRGVSLGYKGRFRATITVNKKTRSLGNHATAQEARDAYDAAAIKYHGKFAMLNRDHFKEKG